MAANDVSLDIYDHGIIVDKLKGRVRCNYCGKIVSGSTRLRCHLGGIRGDVTPCVQVPKNVKEGMKNVLLEKKKGHLKNEVGELEHPNVPWKRNGSHQSNGSTLSKKFVKTEAESVIFPNRRLEVQASVDRNDNPWALHVKQCIGRFFYETGIELRPDIIPSFRRMMSSAFNCDEIGNGNLIPSFQELKGWILENEVKETQNYVDEIRSSWALTGCSVILDGWVDKMGRQLVNILVACPHGTIYLHSFDISSFVGNTDAMSFFIDKVLEEVGPKEVVQIITYSASKWMKTFGKKVMDRHRSIFWTVSASSCIERMLEEIGRMKIIRETMEKAKKITKFIYNRESVLKILKNHSSGRDLVKPSKIRSAASFITLENIMFQLESLQNMFSSLEWSTSTWAYTEEGKRVNDLVADFSFWRDVRMALSATIPLVRVLEWIDDGDNQQLGYIYESMDKAKERIREEFRYEDSVYLPFWEVIDHFWNNYLHTPLHSAGYYLNPGLCYSANFYPDPEVYDGLLDCVLHMAKDRRAQDSISVQLDPYKDAQGDFFKGSGFMQRSHISPVNWWTRYGGNCPELQSFAIRILSQTCNGGSRFELDRSLAEKMLTEGRNQLEQQRLCDLTFVHYNMHLWNVRSGGDTSNNEIDPMDDWIVENGQDIVFPNDELARLDGGEGPSIR